LRLSIEGRYLLYLVKAGHIAVLVELMDGKDIPGGRGQIDYAQGVVRQRFAQSSVLFAVDQLIKGVLKTFNRTFFGIAALIPIPAVTAIVKFVNTVLNLSLTYLDEVILAYHLRSRSENPWESGQRALVLYAQNYKSFLKSAFFLALVIWGLTFVVFLVVLAPVAALLSLLPGTAGPLTLLVAVVFAWGIKQALIEPVAMTSLMQVFFTVTAGADAERRVGSPTGSAIGEIQSAQGQGANLGRRSAAGAADRGAGQRITSITTAISASATRAIATFESTIARSAANRRREAARRGWQEEA
jgi:hypothetical protein